MVIIALSLIAGFVFAAPQNPNDAINNASKYGPAPSVAKTDALFIYSPVFVVNKAVLEKPIKDKQVVLIYNFFEVGSGPGGVVNPTKGEVYDISELKTPAVPPVFIDCKTDENGLIYSPDIVGATGSLFGVTTKDKIDKSSRKLSCWSIDPSSKYTLGKVNTRNKMTSHRWQISKLEQGIGTVKNPK